ncbi:hypothetical protein [Maricaulis sp.]|uniref:hypothetical protein n=1 Tax=Maricaulis sp. TaxID=1486257 RepID=UPI003A95B613
MTNPDIEFESAFYNIEKTRRSLEQFDKITTSFFENTACRSVVYSDADTGNKTYKIVLEDNIPISARDAMSGAIADLRHALDMAMCATFKIVKGKDAPKMLYFPAGNSAGDVRGKLDVFDFPDYVTMYLSSLQLHPALDEASPPNNHLLCELITAAREKHRVACAPDAKITGAGIRVGAKDVICMRIPPRWDSSKQEVEVGTVGPEGHFDYDYHLTFEVVFTDAGPLTGRPVRQTIFELCQTCDAVVSELKLMCTEHTPR